jgi:putative SOS response-associated peptidase YedK
LVSAAPPKSKARRLIRLKKSLRADVSRGSEGAPCFQFGYNGSVCTAYEIGNRGGTFPQWVSASAATELLNIGEPIIIRPTVTAPVIMPDGHVEHLRWGFRREFAAKTKGRTLSRTVVNSREDKLNGSIWRSAFNERRCLVPATAFYEWVALGASNVPLRFTRPEGAWLWIAGIWEEDPQSGRFSMITTDPNTAVAPVHDRMPALLTEEQIQPYLANKLHTFGPSSLSLHYQQVENFLKRDTAPATDKQEQLSLFETIPDPLRLQSPPCAMPEIDEP